MSKPSHTEASVARLQLDIAHELRDAALAEITFGLRSSVAPGGLAPAIVDHSGEIAPAERRPKSPRAARGDDPSHPVQPA